MKNVELVNGVKMPMLGFGTFKSESGEITVNAVKEAILAGYTHIDTAMIYGNEKSVGEGIKLSGVDRKSLFLVTKVWNSDQGYENTLIAFEKSLELLETDYLDLYLIHWPKELNKETWRALEKLYSEKKVRAIGVCNFKIHHLEELKESCEIFPMVNQVELHPQYPQEELIQYCKENNVQIEAWAPLMQGQIFEKEIMQKLALKYSKTIAQITLRWHLQNNVISIPKSINKARIIENFNIFDFILSDDDMSLIKTLNTETRIGPDPDEITF